MMSSAAASAAASASAARIPTNSHHHGNILLDVVILGAGQAGMAAAHRLMTHHNNVNLLQVVEAHDHVGGRTRNIDVATQHYDQPSLHAVELGGTWVSPNHTALLRLCQDLDLEVFRCSFISDHEEGENDDNEEDVDYDWWYWGADYSTHEMKRLGDTLLHTSTSCNINNQNKPIPFANPIQLVEALGNQTAAELETAGKIIDKVLQNELPDLAWETTSPGPNWSQEDMYTTAAKLLPLLSSPDARNILRNAIHTRNAQEPDSVGFLYNLLSFKGCNSVGPDSEFRVAGGSQAIPLKIAQQLGKHRISLGDPVQSISLDTDNNLVHVATKAGQQFTTKSLIVTGSPPALLQLEWDPPLPSTQAQLLQRMPMGTSRKVMAIYKPSRGRWWTRYNLTGDILATALPPHLCVPSNKELIPLFPQCFDTSPQGQDYGVLTCFVEGRANLYYSTLSKDKQLELFHDFLKISLAHYLDSDSASNNDMLWKPDDVIMVNWADDPYVRGAYTGYFGPGVLSQPQWWSAYRNLQQQFQSAQAPIYLAGADYHLGFGNGYMEGAIRSGQQAADLVMQHIREPNHKKPVETS